VIEFSELQRKWKDFDEGREGKGREGKEGRKEGRKLGTLRASPARMMVPMFAILKLKYCTNQVALYIPLP
jgi:hypothetical protein